MTDLPHVAVALGRTLREAGLPVTPDRSARFAAAVEAAPQASVYWTARLTFVSSRDQLEVFDAVFREAIAEPHPLGGIAVAAPREVLRAVAADGEPADLDERAIGASASETERLATTDFGDLAPAELDALSSLLRSLAVATPSRRARRARLARRGERLDVRATLRRARRTGGDPVRHERRRRREEARPLVVLLDVSGSMEPYARAYLLFLEGAARAARAEAFVFATRLTRVTKALRDGRPHAALDRAAHAAPDWSGGTRIGEALNTFNDRWGRRGMARDAVVVVLSDGWERGDPALVGREMERLRRLAHSVVWVNPRAAAPGFAPLAGGMAAALPFVDELLSGHTANALDDVVEAIGRKR